MPIDHTDNCAICLENFYDQITNGTLGDERIMESEPCWHVFHASCIMASFRVSPRCPLCRRAMRGGGVDITDDVVDDHHNASTGYFLDK